MRKDELVRSVKPMADGGEVVKERDGKEKNVDVEKTEKGAINQSSGNSEHTKGGVVENVMFQNWKCRFMFTGMVLSLIKSPGGLTLTKPIHTESSRHSPRTS